MKNILNFFFKLHKITELQSSHLLADTERQTVTDDLQVGVLNTYNIFYHPYRAQPRNQQPTTPLLPIQEVNDENFYSSDDDADITIMDHYQHCNTDDETDNTTVQLITKGKGEHPHSSSHIA